MVSFSIEWLPLSDSEYISVPFSHTLLHIRQIAFGNLRTPFSSDMEKCQKERARIKRALSFWLPLSDSNGRPSG